MTKTNLNLQNNEFILPDVHAKLRHMTKKAYELHVEKSENPKQGESQLAQIKIPQADIGIDLSRMKVREHDEKTT